MSKMKRTMPFHFFLYGLIWLLSGVGLLPCPMAVWISFGIPSHRIRDVSNHLLGMLDGPPLLRSYSDCCGEGIERDEILHSEAVEPNE